MRGHVPEQLHLAGVEIYFEIAEVRPEREIREHPVCPQVPDYRLALGAEEGAEHLDRDIAPTADHEGIRDGHQHVLAGNAVSIEPETRGRLAGLLGHGLQDGIPEQNARLVHRVPDMSSCLVAVVVPASGVRAESPKWTVIRFMETPRTSDAIWASDDAWPPPMSGAPHRTVRLPSSWNPTHAAAESFSHTSLPYDWMLDAIPRPTALRGPDGSGFGPARSSTASIVSARSTSV